MLLKNIEMPGAKGQHHQCALGSRRSSVYLSLALTGGLGPEHVAALEVKAAEEDNTRSEKRNGSWR